MPRSFPFPNGRYIQQILAILLIPMFFAASSSAQEAEAEASTATEYQNPTKSIDILREAPELLQQGVWRHKIDLDLPPTGFQARPDLAIVGGHRSGGMAGTSWTVQGFAAIERRGPNGGAPLRTSADTFYYQGVELIETGSASDRPRTFRLEKDDNQVFSYYPRNDSWSMSRNGWTHRYGDINANDHSNASEHFRFAYGRQELCRNTAPVFGQNYPPSVPIQQTGSTNALKWHLRRISDPVGNRVDYNYTGECDCDPIGKLALMCPHWPKQVSYEGNSISFEFEDRPDTKTMARDGVPRYFNKRLKRITSKIKGENPSGHVYSDYLLSYVEDAPRSLVDRIERLGTSGDKLVLAEAEYDLEPTNFVQGASIPALEAILAEYPTQDVVPYMVNFDGDGFPDLVLIDERIDSYPNTYGLVRGYRNNGQEDFSFIFDPDMTDMLINALGQTAENGFESPRREPGTFKFADIDGDGRTELHATGIWEYEPGIGYRETEWENSSVSGTKYVLADIDGDGLDDRIEPGYRPTWIRNQGQEPFFPLGEVKDLVLPVDYNDEFGLEIQRLMDQCTPNGYSWLWTDRLVYAGLFHTLGIPSFEYPDDYWAGQTNYADVTGDGVADLIYSINNCLTFGDPAVDPQAWSKVFAGRGDGTFIYTDIDAGPPFIQEDSTADVGNPPSSVNITYYGDKHEYYLDWRSWAPVDFDGDGVVEIIHRPNNQARLFSAHFKNAEEGWTFGPDNPAALQLPSVIKALSTYSRSGFKPYMCGCFFHQVTLPGDWNGDGYTDLMVFERDAVSDGASLSSGRAERNYRTRMYRNTRQAPHYALKGVRTRNGGLIALSYGGSARNGMNGDLPVSMPVVEAVTDDRGTSRFHYSGGRIEAGEFLGFAEIEGVHQNGLTFEAEYSLSPAFRGEMVSRTERRKDGTIERFSFFERMRFVGATYTFDANAPYFNPIRRSCQFELSHYEGAGPGLPPDPSQDALLKAELAHSCRVFQRPGLSWMELPRITQFSGLIHGWDARQKVGQKQIKVSQIGEIREKLQSLDKTPLKRPIIGDNGKLRLETTDRLPWQADRLTVEDRPKRFEKLDSKNLHQKARTAHAQRRARSWPILQADLESLHALTGKFVLPGVLPPVTTIPVTPIPEHRMFVKDFEYNADQRVSKIQDHNLTTEPDDWVTTSYSYDVYVAQNVQGQNLTEWSRTYLGGEYSSKYSDHLAIGLPGIINETGTDGSVRAREFEYDKYGRMISTKQQAELSGRMLSEHFTFGDCGLQETVTDRGGRVLTQLYDDTCRLVESSFEGGTKTVTRDQFGRVVKSVADPGAGSEKVTQILFNDTFNNSLLAVDRAELTGRQAIGTFKDPWGRAVLTMRCELHPDLETDKISKIDEIKCATGSELFRLRGWASDGSQRVSTGEFKRGEIPYVSLTYYDERGRLSRKVEPNHAYLEKPARDLLAGFPVAGTPDWIETSYQFGLGYTRTDAPGGHYCIERFSTLSREVECAGQTMGKYTLDAEGRILSTTNEMGVATEFEFDGFFSLKRETTRTSVNTCTGGHTDPSVSYDYDLRGRLLAKTLPNGAELSWTYDDLGRMKSATFREMAGGSPLQAGLWDYADWAKGERTIVETDINGNKTARHFDGFGRPVRAELPDGTFTETTRDASGRPETVRDVDGIVQYFEYDSIGRLTHDYFLVAESETQSCRLQTGNDLCKVGMEYEYDGAGRIIATIDADGVRERHGYNAHGRLAYSARGPWVMQAAIYNDDGTPDRIWTDGAYTRFTYDDFMRPSKICEGADLAAGTCVRTTEIKRDEAGRITNSTLNGRSTTKLKYDELGRLIVIGKPEGGEQTVTYGIASPACALTDEEGLTTRWNYDGLGRLTTLQPPEFDQPRLFAYTYGTSVPGTQISGSKTTITEPDGGVWNTNYDFADRPVHQTRPDGTVLSYDYRGSQLTTVSLRDVAGSAVERVRMGYDGLGRLAYEAGPSLDNGPYLPGQYGLSISYTDAGRPLERTGPLQTNGNVPSFATRNHYGPFGMVQSETQVGVADTRFNYDLAHRYPRLKTVSTGPGGATRTTSYDYAAGGLDVERITHSGPVSGSIDPRDQKIILEFGDYDYFGQPGRVTRIEEDQGQSKLSYQAKFATDREGRLLQSASLIGVGKSRSVSYQYRKNGEISRWLVEGEGGQEISYDNRGRLERVSLLDNKGRITQYAYQHETFDAIGRPIETSLGDGGQLTYQHDQLGRLVEQTATLASGAVRRNVTHFDARGLPDRETVATNGDQVITDFTYSPEGWLASEIRKGASGAVIEEAAYEYDVAGNRTAMLRPGLPETRYVYGSLDPSTATGDALIHVETGGQIAPVEWDSYGGIITDYRGYGIVRDATGRASEIWDPNGYKAAELTRDHLHRATQITTSVQTRRHLWGNPLSKVYPLATWQGGDHMSYVALEQSLFGVEKADLFETAVTDRGGTLLNDGNTFIDLAQAFGQGVQKPNSGITFIFAGQEILEGVPFLNAQQRLYDPESGLFASTDPLGELGSRHRFRYAGNAPTIRLDPLGTEAYDEQSGIGETGSPDISAESAEAVTIDISQTGGVALSGWDANDSQVTDPDGTTYPVTESHRDVMMEASDGSFVNMTAYFFFDKQGDEQWVLTATGSGAGEIETTSQTEPGAAADPNSGTETTISQTPNDDDNESGGGNSGGSQQSGDTGADYSDPPPNFNGSAADWAGRESDGYFVGDDGYGRTPSGQLVIPGLNDALNPSPLKVLINLGADTVDDTLNDAPGMWAGKKLGLIDPKFSPANDAIKGAGLGYTPSEAPREAVAETSVSIMLSAVSGPASAAAAARGRAVVARGCTGPLGSLPKALRVVTNVNCFAPDTLVLTRDGKRRIDELEPGEEVACGENDGANPDFCAIDAVMITPNRSFTILEIKTTSGKTEALRVTPNHRFHTGDKGWVEVKALKPGDTIGTADGVPAQVVAVRPGEGGGGDAYNLEVAGAHTYYAGETGLFTHNGGPGGVCPVTKIRNHKQLGELLGRPGLKNSGQVTVGEIKDLFAKGKISRTAMNDYLRGKSSSQRKFLLKEARTNGGKVTARAGDWLGLIPASEARNGKNWHVGHIGTALRDVIATADPNTMVNKFRQSHWSGTVFESAADNVNRGAGTTMIDQTLRTLDFD